MPIGISSKRPRATALASRSRGYHASGVTILRPPPQIHFHAVATIPYQGHLGFDFGFSEFWLDGQVETGILRFGPVPLEGRLAIVTNAGRDAVDADGAADERR